MATINLTEILGSDNIAGSRITINDNFKKLANGVNTIETYLDTVFSPGGYLTIGGILIKKYTNSLSTNIFTCEASGQVNGNLTLAGALAVSGTATFSNSITLGGTAGVFTIGVPVVQSSGFTNPQFASSTWTINLQELGTSGNTARSIGATASFANVSVVRLSLTGYSGTSGTNCRAIILPAAGSGASGGYNFGQCVTFLVDTPAPVGTNANFGIALTNLDQSGPTATYTDVVFNATGTDAPLSKMRQSAITVTAGENGWRVINAVGLARVS
jgi:hypothetical protein